MAEYIVYGHDGWISSVINGELIRCKDCKRYKPGYITADCPFLYDMLSDDDYCSYAERKEDAD